MAAAPTVPDGMFQMWLDASRYAVTLRHPGMTDKQVLQVMGYALRDELEAPDGPSPARLAGRYRAYQAWLRNDGTLGARS